MVELDVFLTPQLTSSTYCTYSFFFSGKALLGTRAAASGSNNEQHVPLPAGSLAEGGRWEWGAVGVRGDQLVPYRR